MKLYPSLSDDLADWTQRQPVFFTGSAGTHGRHVNVSPKGMAGHFAVLNPNKCAYIDRTGSGCETISHVYENGRLCLMFMSFGSRPRILRLFCHATVVEWDSPAFPGLVRDIARGERDTFDGARAVIVCNIWEVQTSCGFAVPRIKKGLYALDDEGIHMPVEELLRDGHDGKIDELAVFEERPTLDKDALKQVQRNNMQKYQAQANTQSLDGLPGLRAARRDAGQRLWVGDAKVRVKKILAETEAIMFGFCLAVGMYFVLRCLLKLCIEMPTVCGY